MRKFKTESKKLLDLMINSIYTNREIFLRELISNASDAVDKLYFKSLTDSSIQLTKDQLGIDVAFDNDARTITVSDNGIGMTQEDLDRNLGTIAHSDSMAFKTGERRAAGRRRRHHRPVRRGLLQRVHGGASLCAWCRRPTAATRRGPGRSDGVEGYTIEEAQREGNGTDIILTLKDNTDEGNFDQFLSEYGLKDLIKRYSNYVRYPVRMEVSKSRQKPKPEDAGDDYKPEYETVHRGRDHQLHGADLEAQQVRRTTGRVQRVLQADLPRLHRPGRHVLHPRRGRAVLRRVAVHPRPRAVRPVQQGLQEGPGAVQLQRADHGEVRGPAARPLQLRPRRRGQPGPHAQHLA